MEALDDVRLVALTATPPYDAAAVEWSRYEGLCGPIDLEMGPPSWSETATCVRTRTM